MHVGLLAHKENLRNIRGRIDSLVETEMHSAVEQIGHWPIFIEVAGHVVHNQQRQSTVNKNFFNSRTVNNIRNN